MLGSAQAADGVDAIKQRGTLIVGVKADYKPFGFRDPTGNVVGIEPDLAADIAKRLGVKLELVPVGASNRIEFLQQGKIDLLIATMSDKPERRRVVQAIEPLYYSDYREHPSQQEGRHQGLGRTEGQAGLRHLGGLVQQGRRQPTGPKSSRSTAPRSRCSRMKQGNCIGYVYDQTFLQGKLLDDEWKTDYALPLKGILRRHG